MSTTRGALDDFRCRISNLQKFQERIAKMKTKPKPNESSDEHFFLTAIDHVVLQNALGLYAGEKRFLKPRIKELASDARKLRLKFKAISEGLPPQ